MVVVVVVVVVAVAAIVETVEPMGLKDEAAGFLKRLRLAVGTSTGPIAVP
jgi:hypothetical protein